MVLTPWLWLLLLLLRLGDITRGSGVVYQRQSLVKRLGECFGWHNSSLIGQISAPGASICIHACSLNTSCQSVSYSSRLNRCTLYNDCIRVVPSVICGEEVAFYEKKQPCDSIRGDIPVFSLAGLQVEQNWLGQYPDNGLVYHSCTEALEQVKSKQGAYSVIQSGRVVPLWCELDEATNLAWTVIQRRVNGLTDFQRGWDDYKAGFGDLKEEFWLGLETIHRLSTSTSSQLMVTLEDWDGEVRSALYTSFSLTDEADGYMLSIGGFVSQGLANSFSVHNGHRFSTFDQGPYPGSATNFKGAWWYTSGHHSNLNGLYYQGGTTSSFATGAVWYSWRGFYYSYKYIEIKMAPYIIQ